MSRKEKKAAEAAKSARKPAHKSGTVVSAIITVLALILRIWKVELPPEVLESIAVLAGFGVAYFGRRAVEDAKEEARKAAELAKSS